MYMYVYTYACMYVCVYINAHIYTGECICNIYQHIYIYDVSIGFHIYMHTYIHSDMGHRVAGRLGRVGRGDTARGRLLSAEEGM